MIQPESTRPEGSDARLTARLLVVHFARAKGIKAAARSFQTTPRTVRKWLRRYGQFGAMGLLDRSRAPLNQPRKIPPDLEQRVVSLRREHPSYGARRLIREFGLPLSHGAVERILHAKKLVQSREGRSGQTEEEARMASLLKAFGSQGIPGDMGGDAESNQFSIPNLARELKRVMLKSGSQECEQLNANVRNGALVIHFCMLLERFQAHISADQDSKETLQADEPPEPTVSLSDILDEVGAIEFQEHESKETPQGSGTRWNGPDDPKFKAFVEKERKRLAYHSELAKLFGVTRACEEISDDHLSVILADMVASMSKGWESVFNSVMRDVVADVFVANGLLPGPHYWPVVGFWSNLLVAGLLDEFGRRADENEDADGRGVAALIVEEDRRAELLEKLADKASQRLWFPGEYPGQSEEGPALAREKIWESVSNLVAKEPPAASPEVLSAFMRGALNRVLDSARSHVQTLVKTELRRSARLVFADHVFPTRKWEEETDPEPLTTQLPDETREDPDWALLVEQVPSKAQLTDQERKLIEFLKEGHTQEDAAAKFGISQSTVNKYLQKAKEKLAQAAGMKSLTGRTA